jgi:hypothetical protein
MYTDAQDAAIPDRLYRTYALAINEVITGFQDEKKWKLRDVPPPLPIYTLIRRQTSGAIPYCKYVALQNDYRELPDYVLEHQHILRLHELTGDIVGYHNDFISLHHELARKGDVINIVQVIAHERAVSYEEAWMLALELHDDRLAEFVLLQENLPDFGEWQNLAERYVHDLGTNIQGIWRWQHTDTLRYIPNMSNPPTGPTHPVGTA